MDDHLGAEYGHYAAPPPHPGAVQGGRNDQDDDGCSQGLGNQAQVNV
jgi:hypothetical protein